MAKKYWNDHLSNFKLEDSGEYNYRGSFYALDSVGDYQRDSMGRDFISRRFLIALWPYIIISLAASLLAGMFPATGAMNTWYVILPFGLTIAMGFLLVYHLAKLTKGLFTGDQRGMVREYIFDKTWNRIGAFTKVMLVTSVLTIVLEVFHLLIKGKGDHFSGAVILLICMALTALSAGVLLHHYTRVKWQKIAENES